MVHEWKHALGYNLHQIKIPYMNGNTYGRMNGNTRKKNNDEALGVLRRINREIRATRSARAIVWARKLRVVPTHSS